jgi:hypothetical protein
MVPGSTFDENRIAWKSVSMPVGRDASVGLVVGDGGEKKVRGEGVGEGLDTSVTPGVLMVDETRRSLGPLANWTFLGDEVPVHIIIKVYNSVDEPNVAYPSTVHADA